jgi:hypothetical protein
MEFAKHEYFEIIKYINKKVKKNIP